MSISILHKDCIEYMKSCDDGQFSIAITDPPYGLNYSNNPARQMFDKCDWDKSIPTDEYWEQLFRVSQNQIIWGGNYFPLPPTQCFIFWYKQNPVDNFSDGELAWTSFKRPAMCFDFRYYGGLQGKTKADDKIHPTQKPVELYKWCLKNFAKQGDKILDTHLGSGSIAIAVDDMNKVEGMNLSLVGCEINEEYFKSAMKRIEQKTAQHSIFE